MSDIPFGFGKPNDPDDESGRDPDKPRGDKPADPFGMFGDSQQMADMLRRFADMMSWQGGPVNWDLAKDIARQVAAEGGDPTVAEARRAAVAEALRLADLWLDDSTTFPSGISVTEAWSRAEWVEHTLPVWSKLCDPLAERVVQSMGENMPQEMQAMAGPLLGMVKQMGGMMVGQQSGQAIGALAREVVGSTDVGLPVGPEGHGVLLPSGVDGFADGLEVPLDEVRLYLALREAAHHRLFVHVPWLRQHLFRAVEDYARGISFDMSRLEESIGRIDIANPEAIQELLSGGEALFQPEDTPAQKAALGRLETALALVEGWVSTVVDASAADRLPHAVALAEAVRRRRASGGPAERTFASLVGLELRPRRLREAATVWASLTEARGVAGRDAVWAHPDLLPSAEDLDDPEAFIQERGISDALDLDISQLTDGDSDGPDAAGGDGGPGEGPDGGDDPKGPAGGPA
ncbi:MAG: hydrolase [Streptosporangiales bacterium]|nr:hydrolase [Streptosporangiales bacterium]